MIQEIHKILWIVRERGFQPILRTGKLASSARGNGGGWGWGSPLHACNVSFCFALDRWVLPRLAPNPARAGTPARIVAGAVAGRPSEGGGSEGCSITTPGRMEPGPDPRRRTRASSTSSAAWPVGTTACTTTTTCTTTCTTTSRPRPLHDHVFTCPRARTQTKAPARGGGSMVEDRRGSGLVNRAADGDHDVGGDPDPPPVADRLQLALAACGESIGADDHVAV